MQSQTESQHLGTLFLMHANGTKVDVKYCPTCKTNTAHGKTPKDKFWVCLTCLNDNKEAKSST